MHQVALIPSWERMYTILIRRKTLALKKPEESEQDADIANHIWYKRQCLLMHIVIQVLNIFFYVS